MVYSARRGCGFNLNRTLECGNLLAGNGGRRNEVPWFSGKIRDREATPHAASVDACTDSQRIPGPSNARFAQDDSGSVSVKVEPCPGPEEVQSMVPLFLWASSRLTQRPSPVPAPALVVKKGSKRCSSTSGDMPWPLSWMARRAWVSLRTEPEAAVVLPGSRRRVTR